MGMRFFYCNIDGKNYEYVATETKKEAALKLNVSVYYFNKFGSETGNKDDVEVLSKNPGVVFVRKINSYEGLLWKINQI